MFFVKRKKEFLFIFLCIVLLLLACSTWSESKSPEVQRTTAPTPWLKLPEINLLFNTELKAALVFDRVDSPILAAY